MKNINEKGGMILLLGVIYLLILSPVAFAASYSRSFPQYSQPGTSVSYLERQGVSLTPDWDEEKCDAGQDFVLQINPAGCTPAVVPSPLLEEQNVPIFCPIRATNINPLIDVEAIEYLDFSFNGTRPKEIAGVAYHPARAALRTGETLLNSPILENIGYAVIVLKQQKNESAMPEWVEGNLSVKIRYDIQNAFGIGKGVFYLPELREEEWDSNFSLYGFWDNKFFLRAESIDVNSARLAIYSSKDLRISSVNLPNGQTSNIMYLPGQYCKAGVQLRLNSLDNPGTRVRLKVDGDVTEVVKGESFLDNKCKVTKITSEYVEVYCYGADDGSRTLKLNIYGSIDSSTGDWEENYRNSIENYLKVVNEYPLEKGLEQLKDGTNLYYGEQALYEGINLAGIVNNKNDISMLQAKLKESYDRDHTPLNIKDSKSVKINGIYRQISLIDVVETDFDDYGVLIEVDGEEVKLIKDQEEGVGNVDVQLISLTEDYARINVEVGDRRKTLTVREGETEVYEATTIRVKEIHLTKVAKVSVIPNINYAKTESSLHFKIGIEKRAIKLSDDKIRELIKNINETIQEWEDRAEKLGKIVKTMKGACLATGAVLTIKNLFQGITSQQTTARQYAMRGVDGQGGVMSYCRENIGETYKTYDHCLSDKEEDITITQRRYEGIINQQETLFEDIRERPGVISKDRWLVLGEEKTINNDRFLEEYVGEINTIALGSEIEDKLNRELTPNDVSISELKALEIHDIMSQDTSLPDYIQKEAEDSKQKILNDIIARDAQSSVQQNEGIDYGIIRQDDNYVRYFEASPNENVPSIVPLPERCIPPEIKGEERKGWYVGVKETLDGSVHESWGLKMFYICNAKEDGRIDFAPEIGSPGKDCCRGFLGSESIDSGFCGLQKDEAKALYDEARGAFYDAASGYDEDREFVYVCGEKMPVKNVPSTPLMQCQDFMSPTDCKILFNICDPVVCPSSRCNFGGTYYLVDVIQSGIIGSTFACLHNFIGFGGDVYIPVCLSGIHAGMQGLISVFKSYRDCLQHKLETGETIGFCDEIYSIQLCDFFWKQVAPFADIVIPKLLELVTGQFVRGGGEYMSVQAAWQNAENSVKFFTQYYAVNAYKMFKAKTLTEVGSEMCRNYLSTTYPSGKSFLDALTEPVSPPQFHGWLDYSLHTSATVPPTHQYSVFYHIYAGTETDEVAYLVYMRGTGEMGGRTVKIDQGKIEKGGYKTEKRDFLQSAGYTEICIVVGTQEECGFGRVSTSAALNYVQTQYVEQQRNANIDSEEECVYGTRSAYSFVNPNLQSGAQDFVNPDLRGMGIVRVCSTTDPGENTDENRWEDVGHCGDERLRCYLDTKSVADATSLDKIGEDGTLSETERLKALEEDYMTTPEGNTKLLEINDKIEKNKGNEAGLKNVLDEIKSIEDGRNEAGKKVKKLFFDPHKAGLLLLKGRVYKELVMIERGEIDAITGGDSICTSICEEEIGSNNVIGIPVNSDVCDEIKPGNVEILKSFFYDLDRKCCCYKFEEKSTSSGTGVDNGDVDVKEYDFESRTKDKVEGAVQKIDDACLQYLNMLYEGDKFKYESLVQDPLLLIAIMKQESNCGREKIGAAGEIGVMHLTQDTANQFCGGININSNLGNIECGARVLKAKYDLFRHNCEFDSCNHPFSTGASNNRDSRCVDDTCVYKYKCESIDKYYSGWEAALRAYNGWSCEGGNQNYVEKVLDKWKILEDAARSIPIRV